MERQKMKHRRQLGLRQGMLGIILLCWVLPVVLIVTLGGVYILDSMTRQYRSDMMRSAQSAAAITGRNLDSMIAASRKASYIATMGNAWASYTKTGDYVTFYNEMQTFLTQQYRYDDKFRNTIVTLVDDPAAPIYTSNTSYTSIRKYQQHVRDEVLVRSEALGTGIGFFAADGSLYMMRNLLDANYRTYGVLVMELNTDTLFDSMRSVIWMTDATVWLGDAEYTVAGSVRDAGELRGNIRAGGQGGAPAQGSYAVWGSESVVPGCALEYIVYSDTAAMRAQLRSTALLLAALLAALLPLMGAVIAFLYRKVNRPIVTLSGASAHIEQGEFGIQVDAGRLGSKEFAYLGNSFNAMSDKLKNQFERIYKEELALRDAKIMALQSQINPHFLNNTLEIINWEARLADDVKVCQMLEALSTMLNAAMDRKHRPLIHLSEEMMYVDAYLFIIRERQAADRGKGDLPRNAGLLCAAPGAAAFAGKRRGARHQSRAERHHHHPRLPRAGQAAAGDRERRRNHLRRPDEDPDASLGRAAAGGNGQRFAGHPQRTRAGKDHLRAGERPFHHNH